MQSVATVLSPESSRATLESAPTVAPGSGVRACDATNRDVVRTALPGWLTLEDYVYAVAPDCAHIALAAPRPFACVESGRTLAIAAGETFAAEK